jgi:hypothetical protein
MIYWLYHDETYIPAEILDFSRCRESYESEEGAMKSIWGFLAKMFILGEKYHIPRLQNHAMDGMLIFSQAEPFNIHVAPFVYKNTSSKTSALRRLIVRLSVCDLGPSDVLNARDTGFNCPELLFDMAVAATKVKGDYVDRNQQYEGFTIHPKRTFCGEFHTHGEGKGEKCESLHMYCPGGEELSH